MKNPNAAQVQHNFTPAKVLYLTGDINYSNVHTLEGKSILSSRTLKFYNERWPHFIRIHRAYLVNPEYIYSCVVISSIQAHLILHNGARLPISRRRILEVVEKLGIELHNRSFNSTHLIKPEWNTFVPAQVRVA